MKSLYLVSVIVCLAGCAMPYEQDFDAEKAAKARLALGLAYLDEGALSLAYKNLDKAMRYTPKNSDIQLGMARYEQAIGEYSAADARYQRLLGRNKTSSSAVNVYYGRFLCDIGEYDNAQAQFKQAMSVKNYQYRSESLQHAGYCALKKGNMIEAKQYFAQVLALNPADRVQFLVAGKQYLAQNNKRIAGQLVDLYETLSAIDAASLDFRIRMAKQYHEYDKVTLFGGQLAQMFPSSKEYKQFLANEYEY